ncbi:alpha-mannosidase 2C1-like isoform X1 [Ruditapes philippinarum]|uniref:alpha-mannosidase 2C1-like isoform X1 n=2 Tax=Ruditapes philippinarum TaxID=129788 RepID=UPI00295B95FB|nr:alpha-mannosidase 2C1-like isoform X1 [Ruditapes philippinarum]
MKLGQNACLGNCSDEFDGSGKEVRMEPVVLKHRRTTLERAEKFISTKYFADVNLTSRLYPKKAPVQSIKHWAAPLNKYTPYKDAVKQKYKAVKVGQSFGPTWATHWFHISVTVPRDWTGEEVRLRWDSSSEALVWVDGEPRQGLCKEYERFDFPLTEKLTEDHLSFTVYVEMACNGMFGAGTDTMISPPNLEKQFTLSTCEVAVYNRQAFNLYREVEFLHDIAKHLPEGSERGYQALYTVNEMLNACDVNDTDSYSRCHEIANRFLRQKNGDSQHKMYAMGHAHIDTAWLWPYSETIRKCARSWSCTIRLMEKYPDFTFTCSQAQQYEWVKERYPSLYADIKKYVAEGRFIPVGGTWVEMDGLLPSGESFIRQFLYGQQFFKKEFGITCKEFWLPDTFGYSGQLPQIMRHCGITRFLTQKMSWNLVNKFPHHTFWWEGIDCSRVLAHFPPGDCYTMRGKVEEVLRTTKNFKDKGRSDKTAFLFGFGDGGNGPSEEMVERLTRMKDVDGLPKVKMSTPDQLFSDIEAEDGGKLCRWAGELYLELHNGTYTTHAKVKKMNRKCEFLLHDAEFMSCIAMVMQCKEDLYPSDELLRLWKLLLLNQFHDVLPGSSIGMVYDDAHRYYNDIMQSGNSLCTQASHHAISKSGTKADGMQNCHVIWNNQSWDRTEVIAVKKADSPGKQQSKKRKVEDVSQVDSDGNNLYCVTVPSYGYSVLKNDTGVSPVEVKHVEDGLILMKNECVEAYIDKTGRVTKMFLHGSARNAVSDEFPANQFIIHDDIPLYWDAWDIMDYHLETRKPVETVMSASRIVEKGPLRAAVKVQLKISERSHIEQLIILDAQSPYLKFSTKVVWNESRKLLKVEFPTSVHTREATYDIQCGHIKRPNHQNTSWDTARFEVCGHKWSDLSEYDFGVAVLNDCKYGHSAVDNILRMSLLRSPKSPDNMADIETHEFNYALMPHHGTFQAADVIKHAYCFNNSLHVQHQQIDMTAPNSHSYFKLDNKQVVLENVKKSEEDRALVIRLYESYGGGCSATLSTTIPLQKVTVVNGLEDEQSNNCDLNVEEGKIYFRLKPFQILSLKLYLQLD